MMEAATWFRKAASKLVAAAIKLTGAAAKTELASETMKAILKWKYELRYNISRWVKFHGLLSGKMKTKTSANKYEIAENMDAGKKGEEAEHRSIREEEKQEEVEKQGGEEGKEREKEKEKQEK